MRNQTFSSSSLFQTRGRAEETPACGNGDLASAAEKARGRGRRRFPPAASWDSRSASGSMHISMELGIRVIDAPSYYLYFKYAHLGFCVDQKF
jgi:hypothetical protein